MINILYEESLTPAYRMLLFFLVFTALIFSLVLHEIGHAFAALKNGDSTAKFNRRLSLNPIRHFDPIGLTMLVFVGFGYAKPVPVNPQNFRNQKKGMFTVSIAGVSINMLIAFVFCALFVIMAGVYDRSNNGVALEIACQVFYYIVRLNIALFFFNLLPLYPLDGFRVVESLTRYDNKITSFLRRYGMYILFALIGVGLILSYVPADIPALKYLDVLSLYIDFVSGKVTNAFIWFWSLIF